MMFVDLLCINVLREAMAHVVIFFATMKLKFSAYFVPIFLISALLRPSYLQIWRTGDTYIIQVFN